MKEIKKNQETYTFKKIVSAVLIGALLGVSLFYKAGLKEFFQENDRQRLEQCGPEMNHCQTAPYIIDVGPAW